MSITINQTEMVTYVRRYLNDISGSLWPDNTITRYILAGEVELTRLKPSPIWKRSPVAIVENVATYQLDPLIKDITNITYRGYRVDFISQPVIASLSPVYRTQFTQPRWATMEAEGYHLLRFFPGPSENLPIIDDDITIYTDKNIANNCVVSAYYWPDPTITNLQLPAFLERRILKSYICRSCFRQEGPGQNLKAFSYWDTKWEGLKKEYVKALDDVYAAVETNYDNMTMRYPFRKGRPILPANFGPIVKY